MKEKKSFKANGIGFHFFLHRVTSRSHRRKKNGFTLVELVVVISVVAILTGAVVIHVDSLNEDTRLSNAAHRAHADVKFAQEMALTHKRIVRFEVIQPNNYYQVRYDDTGDFLKSPITGEDMIVHFAEQGKEYFDVSITGTDVGMGLTFDQQGLPYNNGGSISGTLSVMCLNDRIYVTVNAVGHTALSEDVSQPGCGWCGGAIIT